MAYKIPEIFRQGNLASSYSTVRQGHRLHPIAKERMVYFELMVPNGFTVPKPLPFGIFAEVEPTGSMKESLLQVWVADGYYTNSVSFAGVKRKVFNFNELIKEAEVEERIVMLTAPFETDSDTWEATVEPIDDVHGLLRKVQVVETNVVNFGIRDEQLRANHSASRELVKSSVAEAASDYPSDLQLNGSVYEFVEYEEVKCGWYVKTIEQLTAGEGFTYGTTRSKFWPAVMESFEVAELTGETDAGEEYIASILLDVRYKESYNGPCQASIQREWQPFAPTDLKPIQMITDAFQYQGIFFNFTSPESLHPTVTIEEFVGEHPVLLDNQFRVKTFPGTALTDWPPSIIYQEDPVPYKGGFIWETVTIQSPS